jgi:hypothetical protein
MAAVAIASGAVAWPSVEDAEAVEVVDAAAAEPSVSAPATGSTTATGFGTDKGSPSGPVEAVVSAAAVSPEVVVFVSPAFVAPGFVPERREASVPELSLAFALEGCAAGVSLLLFGSLPAAWSVAAVPCD